MVSLTSGGMLTWLLRSGLVVTEEYFRAEMS